MNVRHSLLTVQYPMEERGSFRFVLTEPTHFFRSSRQCRQKPEREPTLSREKINEGMLYSADYTV